MELKLNTVSDIIFIAILLIVPYGIETLLGNGRLGHGGSF